MGTAGSMFFSEATELNHENPLGQNSWAQYMPREITTLLTEIL
jgi:hypothetical protein